MFDSARGRPALLPIGVLAFAAVCSVSGPMRGARVAGLGFVAALASARRASAARPQRWERASPSSAMSTRRLQSRTWTSSAAALALLSCARVTVDLVPGVDRFGHRLDFVWGFMTAGAATCGVIGVALVSGPLMSHPRLRRHGQVAYWAGVLSLSWTGLNDQYIEANMPRLAWLAGMSVAATAAIVSISALARIASRLSAVGRGADTYFLVVGPVTCLATLLAVADRDALWWLPLTAAGAVSLFAALLPSAAFLAAPIEGHSILIATQWQRLVIVGLAGGVAMSVVSLFDEPVLELVVVLVTVGIQLANLARMEHKVVPLLRTAEVAPTLNLLKMQLVEGSLSIAYRSILRLVDREMAGVEAIAVSLDGFDDAFAVTVDDADVRSELALTLLVQATLHLDPVLITLRVDEPFVLVRLPADQVGDPELLTQLQTRTGRNNLSGLLLANLGPGGAVDYASISAIAGTWQDMGAWVGFHPHRRIRSAAPKAATSDLDFVLGEVGDDRSAIRWARRLAVGVASEGEFRRARSEGNEFAAGPWLGPAARLARLVAPAVPADRSEAVRVIPR